MEVPGNESAALLPEKGGGPFFQEGPGEGALVFQIGPLQGSAHLFRQSFSAESGKKIKKQRRDGIAEKHAQRTVFPVGKIDQIEEAERFAESL